jgi:hypothetical protein
MENNRIEYKRELTDGLEKEVIAFLNYHDGGLIYIGVDTVGSVYGVFEQPFRFRKKHWHLSMK